MGKVIARGRRALDGARVAVIPAFGAGAIVGLLAGVPVVLVGGAGAIVGLVGGALVGAARAPKTTERPKPFRPGRS